MAHLGLAALVESLERGRRQALVERLERSLETPLFPPELAGFADLAADHDRVLAKNPSQLACVLAPSLDQHAPSPHHQCFPMPRTV